MIWIKLHSKCELSFATESSIDVLLGAIKLVKYCLIILCFQKKNSASNIDQAIAFWQNSLLQRDFVMPKSAWEYSQILFSIYAVYFVSYKIGLVQPATVH